MPTRTRLPFPVLATLALAANLAAQPAPAADPAAASVAPPKAAEEVVQLEKLDVSARREEEFATQAFGGTKTDTPLVETPQTVSVITRAELDLRNVKGVAEALRYTAGISTDTYGEDPRGYAWAKIRGFAVSFDSQYLDGIRLFNYEFPEAFGLERIEVMKGPSSVLYGQAAPGGLINSVSKRPVAQPFGEITAEIGTGESYETSLDTGGPVDADGTVLYRVTALFNDTAYDSNGYNVDARRSYLAPALSWRVSEATTLTVLTSFLHTESTQIPGFAAAPSGGSSGVYINNPNWDLEENDIYRVGYQLEHHATSDLVFRQSARVSRYDVYDRYLSAGSYTGTVLSRTAAIWQSASLTAAVDNQAELRLTGDNVEQTFLAGLDYGWSSADTQYFEDAAPGLDVSNPNYGAPVAAPTTLLGDSYQTIAQTGIYAQDQIKFATYWVGTLSVRHDWVTNDYKDRLAAGAHTRQNDEALSGRAGLAYVADNGLAPYVSYSTSFFPNSGADVNGSAFDPTTGSQYEIGLKYAPKTIRGTATVTLYDLTQDNVVTSDTANPGFSRAAGEWRSRGIEFEGKLGVTTHVDLILAASHNDVEIIRSNDGDEGNTPGLTPETNASAWLDYTFREGALRGFTFGGGVRYVGSSYTDNFNTEKNTDYVNFDLAVRYIRGAWVAAFNVGNVFDDVEVFGDGSEYYKTGGRTLRASLAYRW